MQINADFAKPAFVRPRDDDWRPSPLPGVERLMLDRIGEEVARATSIVRYAAGSRFSSHTHDLGEEFLVVDGVFSDSSGDFSAGSYVRNPPGSSHAPWSDDGCTIFVKLRQFDPTDTARVVIDSASSNGWSQAPGQAGHRLDLYSIGSETVDMLRLSTGNELLADGANGGVELFVFSGRLAGEDIEAPRWSWLRLPPGETRRLSAMEPTTVYRKTGHLT